MLIGIHNPKSSQMAGWSGSSTNGLGQLMDSHVNDLIASYIGTHAHHSYIQNNNHTKLLMTSLWINRQQALKF
jgi:hypothetical protein